ncbi:uncharacterized protein [Eurosta solidaginis]|uniref:uncharacterized protein n=1 Tax=Eurosta solidaginis TaxID=178769 RepID=UPI003530A8C5
MDAKKKKTRQRNRPRNKANRLQQEPETEPKQEFNEVLIENSENKKGNIRTEQENTFTADKAADKVAHQEEKTKATNIENKQSQSQAKKDNVVLTPISNAQNESLKLLQQMMRTKLLKQEQPSGVSSPANENIVKSSKTNQSKLSNTVRIKESTNSTGVQNRSMKTECSADINLTEQSVFIANLQKKLENSVANGSTDLSNTLLDNLQKLLNEDPLSDVESSDDDEDYVEYVYKPRQYFLVALCNFCKTELSAQTKTPCSRCSLVYYCCKEHMTSDEPHRQICYAIQQVADSCDGHIFRKCGDFTAEQFRSYRIVTIRKIESIINRPMTAAEQEVILFPRICSKTSCREYAFKKLVDCEECGQVAYCRDKPEHLNLFHQQWCQFYQLFKNMELVQTKFGRIEPPMPTKQLRDIPGACCNTKQILSKLDCAVRDACEFAVLSQISTCPLTAWYALKLCGYLKKSDEITVHLIGAEIEFEVDALHKWELFFLHLNPNTKKLNVVFVGPELRQGNVQFAELTKTKCCRSCRKLERSVSYHFQNQLYHDYNKLATFLKPDLICFFNAGLYRYNGFEMEDTWPETIRIATSIKCPIVVTSYTEYEAPMDISRLMQESSRCLNMVMPPTLNPFASKKPERNFISDEDAPLMFKNFYCFVVE